MLGLQRRVVDGGRLRQGAVAERIDLDLGDVAFGISEQKKQMTNLPAASQSGP